MEKYQRGKVYKIISDDTDKIYIGSSCEATLAHRLAKHKDKYKQWLKDNNRPYYTSYEILKLQNYSIILIENYPCNSKDELISRERHYIELNKNNVVNKVMPFRTKQEWIEDNKDHISDYKKEWNKNNKDKRKNYNMKYKENNKEKIREKSKKYYDDNKEKFKIKDIQKRYKCELCNIEMRDRSKYSHFKTQLHVNLSKNILKL